MSRWIAIPFLFLGLSAVQAQEQKCPQKYLPWTQEVTKDSVFYHCTYTFEPTPGDYRSNLVVWFPTKDHSGYLYYTNSKDKYWCRAFNSTHKEYVKGKPKWNVIAKDEHKLDLITKIPDDAWGPPEHPVCAGSTTADGPGVPMAEPPPPPIAAYTRYIESLKRE